MTRGCSVPIWQKRGRRKCKTRRRAAGKRFAEKWHGRTHARQNVRETLGKIFESECIPVMRWRRPYPPSCLSGRHWGWCFRFRPPFSLTTLFFLWFLPPCLGRLALGNPQAILIQSENQKKGEQFCLRCCCVPIRWLSVLSRAYFSAFSNQIFGLKHHEELKRNSVAQTHLKYNSSFSYRVNEFLADSLAALTCSVHRKCKATAVPLWRSCLRSPS